MTLVFFVLTFFLIVNKHLIKSFIESFFNRKENLENITDQQILDFIKEKSGLRLTKIKLLDTKTTWGMMAGLPAVPYMIISQDAYRNFSKDEMQWLLLHEAGHYKLWHSVKIISLQLLFIAVGFLTIFQISGEFEKLVFAIFLGVLFAILDIQLARGFEYEANYYALARMDNPKGLKNMLSKAKAKWRNKGKQNDSLLQKMFNVWILEIYADLVKKANATRNKDP